MNLSTAKRSGDPCPTDAHAHSAHRFGVLLQNEPRHTPNSWVPCPCRVLSILATLKYAYPRDKIKPFPRSKKTRQLKFVRHNKTGPSMTRFQLGKLFGNTVYSTEYPESPRDPKSMFGLNFIIMSSMFEGVVISMMSTLSD